MFRFYLNPTVQVIPITGTWVGGQLLTPLSRLPSITDENIRDFELAVDAVAEGRWGEALEILDRLPVADRTKDFMLLQIALNDYEPPPNWNGVFTLLSK
ncbi:MAG: hypothetical protein KY476_17660 [Planctomycetes bacterium]|nr:hypothetical protein [Planctomycetota bacterium]